MNYTLSQKQIIKGITLFILLYITFNMIVSTSNNSFVNYRLLNTSVNPYDTIVAPDLPPVH